jgi:aromatase
MRTETSIEIAAPLEKVFQTAANVPNWPKILPHYRYVRVLERSESGTFIAKMAAWRGLFPVKWTSRVEVDAAKPEIRFHHLRAFTRGMNVKWTFSQQNGAVRVTISHELSRKSAFGRWFAEKIIGNFFIGFIAPRTLRCMKSHLESQKS